MMSFPIVTIFLLISILLIIIFTILVAKQSSFLERYQEDLPNYIIYLILYTPLDIRTLLKIVNSYEGDKNKEYKRTLREIIGFLRSPYTQNEKYYQYFTNEARRYLTKMDIDGQPIFTVENLKYFIDGITEEIKKK